MSWWQDSSQVEPGGLCDERCKNSAGRRIQTSVIGVMQGLDGNFQLKLAHRCPPMKVVIVEDHTMFRDVLRKICEKDLEFTVVGEAADGAKAVEVVARCRPDIVLLDLHLPNLDGFSALEAIRKKDQLARVIVLSSHCDEYTVFRAEQARVQAFVDKNTNSIETLKSAIAAVAEGRVWFSEAFLHARSTRLRDPLSFDKVLTYREQALIGLFGAPMSDVDVAQKLGLSVETVEKHRHNIVKKLGLSSTGELARYAREHGFTLTAPRLGGEALLP